MSYSASEIVLFILGQLLVAAAIWGGIRVDIRNMHDKIKEATESVRYAHERIDSIIGWNGNDRRHN